MTIKQSHISFEGNKPENVQFSQTDKQLEITIKQRPLDSATVIGYPLLTFLLVGSLTVAVGPRFETVFLLLNCLTFALPAFLIIYVFIAQGKNQTTVIVSRKAITRLSEPMWLPNQSLDIDLSDIQAMRIGTSIHRVSNWSAYNTYEVQAVTFSGKVKPIIKRLVSSDAATFTLRQIEQFLNGRFAQS